MNRTTSRWAACVALLAIPAVALPQAHPPGAHQPSAAEPSRQAAPDTRQPVQLPEPLRSHTLTNMRDHLLALGEIQEALARGQFDQAADIAEHRLGLSSLQIHGAPEVSKHMPQGMRDAGIAMHRSASRFATVAKDASVSGDLRPALAGLARINQACVACHADYRFR